MSGVLSGLVSGLFSGGRRPEPHVTLEPMNAAPDGIVTLAAGSLVVGRAPNCDLVCPDPALSRKHARFFKNRDKWFLEDLGSANGTTVDGATITRIELAAGQVITFGGKVSFRIGTATQESASPETLWGRAFCLKLVPLSGEHAFVLRKHLSVVGRNENADLHLPDGQVSSIHARIVRRHGKTTLRDTGSRNGTAVNGHQVRQATLQIGDKVTFGDVEFAVEHSWWPTGRAVTAMGSAIVLVSLLVVLVSIFTAPTDSLEPLWTRDMYLEQVESSLVAMVKAHDRTPPSREVALAQVDIARRSLIAADLLRPDRQTEAEIHGALHNASSAPRLHRALHGRDIVKLLQEIEHGPDRAPASGAPSQFNLTNELSTLVAEFGIDTRDSPMPDDLVASVERYTRFWSEDKRGFTERSIERGRPYLEMMRQELRKERLPEIFCYLPFIESGYQTAIESHAGARGLWQFMPGTARDYGLEVSDSVDQRTDPQLATEAACQYLEYLLKIFGPNSFMCAIAAYNKGHNGMRRCLARSGDLKSTWKFWNLTEVHDGCLPDETVAYVPRFLAAVVVFRNPVQFGLEIGE